MNGDRVNFKGRNGNKAKGFLIAIDKIVCRVICMMTYRWKKKFEVGIAIVIVAIVGVTIFSGCIEREEASMSTDIQTPTPAPRFGEVPYLIIQGSTILPSNRVDEWHEMEIINHTMEVEEGWRSGYEIDVDIWIRNTYNLPVDWIEVDVEFINEWNQTYIETDLWSHFIRPSDIAKTYTNTGGEYIPQLKEIHVWGHEHHPMGD